MTLDPVDIGAAPDPVAAWWAADRACRLVALRTSGTTDAPRHVVRTTASWSVHFDAVSYLTGIGAGSRVWLPGPMTGTMTLYAAVHAQAVGATWSTDPAGATHAVLTPAALSRALARAVAPPGMHAIVAGDRLASILVERAANAGVRVSHYYGAAELSFVAWGPGPDDLSPFPGVEVQARDGVLWVRSPGIIEGYAGPPGALRRDTDGWATVGDRGAVIATEQGVRVDIAGRDDAVVTGGTTVLLSDVEAALAPAARGELVAVGIAHDGLGAVVAAVLTDEDDRLPVLQAARSGLDHAARPRILALTAQIPLTPAGKLDRVLLGRALAALRSGDDAAHGIRLLSVATGENG